MAGHDAALNDLMERHATPVFHFLCRMVGNEDDANDLAQETSSAFSNRAIVSARNKNFPPGCSPSRRTWRATISAGARGIRTFRSKRKMRKRNNRLAARCRQMPRAEGSRRLPANAPPPCAPPSGNCRRICVKRLCCANGRNAAWPRPRRFWKPRRRPWNHRLYRARQHFARAAEKLAVKIAQVSAISSDDWNCDRQNAGWHNLRTL